MVDNLCQFLPQDRVGDFSKFNSKELLRETTCAILGDSFVEMHEKLIELEKSRNIRKDEVARLTDELERLQAEEKRMERDVVRMRRRAELLEEIKVRKQKKPWLQF